MLRRTGFWILCMAVLTPPLSGQTLSSLHQVLSSSSLIDRPQVFRDLQSAIRDSIGNVEPGLRLNGFYSRMSTARKQLQARIELDSIRVEVARIEGPPVKYTASFTYRKKTETVSFRDPGRIRSYIGILDSLFSQDGPGFGDQFQVLRAGEKQAVFSAILGVSQPVFSEADRKKLKNDAEKFALLIGRLIVEKCVGEFEKNRTIQELVARGDGLMKIDAPQLQEELQKALDRAREKVNETMARYLNRAEHEVAKVVDTANRLALSGNVGVSVSEAKGAFGGGIMASAMWGPHVQTGAYVNAQFSESMPDSGKPAKSLVGLLVRVAGDAVQADGAVSILFGQGRFKAFETWELGAALSYRAHEHFILGVAYFGLFSSGNQADFRTVHTLATTFKGASPGSPSLLLGRLYTQAPGTNRAVRRWIYQMSFPIPAYR